MAPICYLQIEEGLKSKALEELLCEFHELPVTPANTRQIIHDLVLEKLQQIQRSEFKPTASL